MITWNKVALKLLLIFFGAQAFGQENGERLLACVDDFPEESTVLITDRDFYLAGDKLWFKAFVFVDDELNSDLSKVLYVELFNDKGQVFAQHKFEVSQGNTAGVFNIPAEVNTGVYYLRAYTQYMRNFPLERFFTRAVTIVNPQSETTKIKVSDKKMSEPGKGSVLIGSGLNKETIQLNFSASKKTFGQREAVELNIENPIHANLVVSVRKKGTGYSENDITQILSANPWLAASYASLPPFNISGLNLSEMTRPAALEWVPEVRGLTLTGMIRNKNTGLPVPEVYCITSVMGKQIQLHMSKTHEDGTFIFPYNHLQGNKDIFVAIRNNENRDLEILINKDFSTTFPSVLPMAMPFDSSRHALFEALYINSQLNRTFEPSFKKGAYPEPGPMPLPFNIGSPDLVVEVKNYIDIPTMPEVFRELVPTVSVRGKIGRRKLNVFDKNAFRDYDNPLVLLDNVPVSDVEKLLQLNPAQLKAIEVYHSDYFLGDYVFGGIVSVKTNTEDFAGYKWGDESVFLTYNTFLLSEIFQYPAYVDQVDKQNKKPDFRTLLYWNPEVSLNGHPVKITFFTSDHISEYEVVVQGFTQDGRPCFGSTEIEVLK